MLSGRWHDSHFCWKIGAMSLVNVGVLALSAATAGSADTRRALNASAVVARNITGSFRACRPIRSIGHYTDLSAGRCCLSLSFSFARARLRLLFPRMPTRLSAATTRTVRRGARGADRGAFLLTPAEIVESPETGLRSRIERLLGGGGFGQFYLARRIGRSTVVPE